MSQSAYPFKTSFWFDETLTPLPALERDLDVAVVVIGGGFAGLSTARHLKAAAPELDIALVEARHIGFGASGRNGGVLSMLPPILWLFSDFDHSETAASVRWAVNYCRREIEMFTAWLKQEQIGCDLQPTTHLFAANNRFQQATVRWLARRLEQVGLESDLLATAQASALAGYPLLGGLAYPGYTVNPYQLTSGLRDSLLRQGVPIYENTPIQQLKPLAAGVELITAGGQRIRAEKAVICTNAYTRTFGLEVGEPLPHPYHTYLLALRAPAAGLEAFTVDTTKPFFYSRPYDGHLLFGGIDRPSRAAPQDDQHQPSYHRLYAELLTRFPGCKDVPLAAVWGGAYQLPDTDTPIVRPHRQSSNIILNLGYGGSGVGLTQFSGKMLTGLTLGHHFLDADAERLRALYLSNRVPLVGLAKTGLGVLRRLIVP